MIVTYTVEDAVTLPVPEKNGYMFKGWKLKGKFVEMIEKGTTGNITVSAVWEK